MSSRPPSRYYLLRNLAVHPSQAVANVGQHYSIDFRIPKTASDLAPYVSMQAYFFDQIVGSDSRSQFYQRHRIPKRSRYRTEQTREVWEITNDILVQGHKAFARRFELFARHVNSDFPHASAYGYVRHRGTRENAAIHSGARMLMRADIRNFFPSVSLARLIDEFKKLGMHDPAAVALARFATIDDSLPIGLNASPMLANLVCLDLDKCMDALAASSNCKYSRYADDMTFSGDFDLPSRQELSAIVERQGFELSIEKFRVTKLGQAHYVTGLSVSDPRGPHAPRRMKRLLRQELYYSRKYGVAGHLSRFHDETQQKGVNRLDGTVRYVAYHEAENGARLKSDWTSLLQGEGLGPSYDPIETRPIRYVSCFVDESEFVAGGKHLLALCLVFTEQPSELTELTQATLSGYKTDPFALGDRAALERKGLHFVDSHPDLRTAYIKALSHSHIRAFVSYRTLETHNSYEATYLSLLSKMLPERLMWYDRAALQFFFEENSKIKIASIQETVSQAYIGLRATKNRRPIVAPMVKSGKKLEMPGFSAPDYLLAVFGRFAQLLEPSEEIRRSVEVRRGQFERVRDKIRLIIDVDTGIEFSRRHPFAPL